jgi:hypothetical protein
LVLFAQQTAERSKEAIQRTGAISEEKETWPMGLGKSGAAFRLA